MVDISKLQAVMNEIESEKGPLWLFAIVERETSPPDMWHLLVAGPWTKFGRPKSIGYVLAKLEGHFSPKQRGWLSVIVTLEKKYPAFQDAVSWAKVTAGAPVERQNVWLNGILVYRAIIFRAQEPEPTAQAATV
jgi:hypothetical protein